MENYEAILIVQTKLDTGKLLRQRFDIQDIHDARSLAGSIFHKEDCDSVCVADHETGVVNLYMRKGLSRDQWIGVS